MKKLSTEKPWYFAVVVLGLVVQPIFEWVVMQYFDEKAAKEILGIDIPLKTIIPIVAVLMILYICIVVYCGQLHKRIGKLVTPDEMQVLNKSLTNVVEQNEYIESVQAYQYRAQNDKTLKFVKLNYLCGIANERIEINSILQTYFYFPYSIYKRVVSVSGYYDNYLAATDPIKKQDYFNDFLENGRNLCEQLLKILNNEIKSIDDIKECHCEMYRVLAKLLPAISNQSISWLLEKNDIELALIKKKKTGILGSIILNEMYIFRNQNSIGKQERIYFTFPFDCKKHIVLIASMNGHCFPSDDMGSIEDYCKSVVEKVYQ